MHARWPWPGWTIPLDGRAFARSFLPEIRVTLPSTGRVNFCRSVLTLEKVELICASTKAKPKAIQTVVA